MEELFFEVLFSSSAAPTYLCSFRQSISIFSTNLYIVVSLFFFRDGEV